MLIALLFLVVVPTSTIALSTTPQPPKKTVVIIGGGWAGYTTAATLGKLEDKVNIQVLEASPLNSGGGLAGGWRTREGRAIEGGVHGFWREYTNTFKIMEEEIGLSLDSVLSPYTPSVLHSKNGRVATAPVLKSSSPPIPDFNKGRLSLLASALPAPLDTALLADFDPARLSLKDRISAVGLLSGWVDFVQDSPSSWLLYDDIDAEKFFKEYGGVTAKLYDELVSPLLAVLPMGPGNDISASAAISCFHVFALQSKGAFDVRWPRGTISELIFTPWREKLESKGIQIRGGKRVKELERVTEGGGVSVKTEDGEEIEADAVILCVGGTSAKKLREGSNLLKEADATSGMEKLRGVTCVAVRIWLEAAAGGETSGLGGGIHGSTKMPKAVAKKMKDSPIAVVGPGVMDGLEETGFCIYDLGRMHEEQRDADTACLEVDFYRADFIADMTDTEVVSFSLAAVSSALKIDPLNATVVDNAIVRARQAVSHFDVGSARASPPTRIGRNVYAAGDYVDRSGHASWSTEKSVVTGKQAALAVAEDLGLGLRGGVEVLKPPVDTAQLALLRRTAKALRGVVGEGTLPLPAPWAPKIWRK